MLIQPDSTFATELNYYRSFRSAYDQAFETDAVIGAFVDGLADHIGARDRALPGWLQHLDG